MSVSEKVLNVILYNMLHLYIKVQSFIFAKNKVEKHRPKKKNTRLKALRKEIKSFIRNSKT